MATKLQIINAALNYLGEPSVNTLNESSEILSAISSIYDNEKQDMLASHPWRFAIKWKTLTKSQDAPDDDRWGYKYFLPADYIQVWETKPWCDYSIVTNREVYSNIDSKWQWAYVYDCDEGLFPPYFTKLMAYVLAAECALLVTENINTAQYWSERMISQKAIAQNRDFTAQPGPTIQDQRLYSEHFI